MILAAYFPPVFFKRMDRRVAAHHSYDLSKARIAPHAKDALMRRRHRPVAPKETLTEADRAAREARRLTIAQEAGVGWQCTNCFLVYVEARGVPAEGSAAGTRWSELPKEWTCPGSVRCERSRTS